MRTIRFYDGTEINGETGLSEGILWLWFDGYSMRDMADMILDAGKTQHIEFLYGDDERTVYDGYTDCILIAIDKDDGRCSVALRRPITQ